MWDASSREIIFSQHIHMEGAGSTYRTFAVKLLSQQLNYVIQAIIDQDKTGFMPYKTTDKIPGVCLPTYKPHIPILSRVISSHGTGCPLSLALFAIAIEPVAEVLQFHHTSLLEET